MAAGHDVSCLTDHLRDCLVMRRALGYKLERVELLLDQFISYLAQTAAVDSFTISDALEWATAPQRSPWWHRQRLSAVRGFAAYLHAIDPTVPVTPADLLTGTSQRAVPYLYSNHDVCQLIDAARRLRQPFRTLTYQTLIGLLAVTGMRAGEAIRLDLDDVDLDGQIITIVPPRVDRCTGCHSPVDAGIGTYPGGRTPDLEVRRRAAADAVPLGLPVRRRGL